MSPKMIQHIIIGNAPPWTAVPLTSDQRPAVPNPLISAWHHRREPRPPTAACWFNNWRLSGDVLDGRGDPPPDA